MSPTTPIVLDRASDEPLYRQIETQLRDAIRDGRLRPGARLPGVRTLAVALGVARITVATAYEQLAAEGYVEGRVGSGTRVAEAPPMLDPAPVRTAAGDAPARPAASVLGAGVVAAVRVAPALASRPAPTLASRPAPALPARPARRPTDAGRRDEVIDLAPASARLDDFPFPTWERLLREAVHELAAADASAPAGAGGDPGLRRALAERLGAARGLRVEPEQVVVTTGDWAAISTIADAWPGPSAPALMEDPGEPWVRALLAARGRRLIAIPTDGRGIRPEMLPSALGAPVGLPVLIHVTPAWGVALGGTLPQERRRELLARAGPSVRILEDDRDAELRLEGAPPPALAGQDPLGRVVHIRGLERDLYPGARLGYFVVPPADVDRLSRFLSPEGRGPGVIEQRAFARFVALGLFDRHLRRLRHRLVERHDALLEAIDRFAGGRLAAVPAQAGRHLAVSIVDGRTTAAGLADAALAAGVRVVPLARLRSLPGPDDTLLVGFGAAEPEVIREGVRRLARAMDALLAGAAGGPVRRGPVAGGLAAPEARRPGISALPRSVGMGALRAAGVRNEA